LAGGSASRGCRREKGDRQKNGDTGTGLGAYTFRGHAPEGGRWGGTFWRTAAADPESLLIILKGILAKKSCFKEKTIITKAHQARD